MSLRAFQIVVRVPSAQRLREALERALRRQKPRPHDRKIVAVLADGWATLVEEGREEVDGSLARSLSELLATESVAVALDGSKLRLELRRFSSGVVLPLPQETLLGRGFVDVEAIAWSALRLLGVPPALRLCGPSSLLTAAGTGDGFAALIAAVPGAASIAVSPAKAAPGAAHRPAAGGRVRVSPASARADSFTIHEARAAPPDRSEGTSPPAEPDLWVESGAGEQCALEVRTLDDLAPTREAAEALVEIEEAQAHRLATALAAGSDGDRIARISFTYKTTGAEGGPQLAALHALLAEARKSRPRLLRFTDLGRAPPLSQAGFTKASRAALGAAFPSAAVLRAHALRLELATPEPGVCLRAPLAGAYAAYLALEAEPQDPAAPVALAVRAALDGPARPLSALPARELLAGLLPSVALEEEAAAAEAPAVEVAPARATFPLAGNLRAALLHDDGARISEVSAAVLEAAGLNFETALTVAVANAEALTLAQPAGISWLDLDEGRVVVFDFDDPAGAGRVLSAQARGALCDLLGEPCFCVLPTRDSLLGCSMLEPEAIAWVEEEAARRVAEGPNALSADLLVITRSSVASSGKGDLAGGIDLDGLG